MRPPQRIENEYRQLINRLLLKRIEGKTPNEVLEAFANLANNPQVITNIAERLAIRMITQVKVIGARSWREAAMKASRGRDIYQLLQNEMRGAVGVRVRELVSENARLIASIPQEVREHANLEILRLQQEGLRPEAIQRYLKQRLPHLTRWKAALIARTETSKAASALTQARSEDFGVRWYQWKTSLDQRVRRSHRIMEDVLVSWDDPPSPEALAHIRSTLGRYNCGQAPNCRCVPLVLIDLSLVSWPAKVYRAGAITRMTRGQFERIPGNVRRAA